MEEPWPHFVADVKKSITGIIVSHRPDHKLNKAFNKDTNYGQIVHPATKAEGFVTRKMINGFNKVEDLGKIVDKGVREVILAHLADQGHNVADLKQEFPKGWFRELHMKSGSGPGPVIRHVRIFQESKSGAVTFLKNGTPRIVEMDDNHHIAFYKDGNGCIARVGRRLEAMQRQQRGEPIVPKFLDDDPGKPLLLWLMKGDMVRYWWNDQDTILVVRQMSGPPDAPSLFLLLTAHNNGLPSADILPLRRKEFRPFVVLISSTQDFAPDGIPRMEKVQVDPLGRVSPLNDA